MFLVSQKNGFLLVSDNYFREFSRLEIPDFPESKRLASSEAEDKP